MNSKKKKKKKKKKFRSVKKKRARYYLVGNHTRVKLLARAKLIFLGERQDDFFFCGEPCGGAGEYYK